jgi:c(7)-type cytochrome triheme protein
VRGRPKLRSESLVTELRAPWALLSVLAMLAIGCDPRARHETLSTLLDGVPTYEEWRNPPAPPERPVREIRYRQRPPMGRVEQPNWQAALVQGIIAPFSSLEPGESTLEAFPLDVELTPEDPTFAVTFRHETHTAWLACDNCHTAVFEMSTGAADITMESIYAGKHCGYCHGTVAFAAETGCAICHAAMAG